ncbi:uncharacterized protein [Oscarella lobularis]|uniref:uncharacterized protein isoform X2 n=1 Tax=Oscarella lobularis TaxID=121494 RepID=UPI0033140F82
MVKRGRICQTCIDSRTSALSAAMSGHLQCLQEAYRSLNVLNERDRFGATPIHYAARHGQLECLRWLVEHSGVSPNAAARNGSTPAHDAAATGYLECLKYLLVNTKCGVHDRTVEGATVLHMACRFGREDVVCWLIDYGNASPSDKGANGVTPVHLCAAKNAFSCLQWLTVHSKYIPNQLTAHGASPAYFAAQEGSLECLRWISERAEGDVSISAKDGMHPVHASAQAGQLNCLRYLIDNCGVSVRTKSSDGATVAHFAAAGGHVDCLRWLLDMDEGLAMVRDNLGGMPMHDAAEEGQCVSLEEFMRRGINMEVKDYDGATPLELAEEHNHEDCIVLLRAAREQKKNAPKPVPPVSEEAEEDLKQKELEEQQRRYLAAAIIQEEEQKIEKRLEKRPSLSEQLDKLKKAQKEVKEERYQEPIAAALPSGIDVTSPPREEDEEVPMVTTTTTEVTVQEAADDDDDDDVRGGYDNAGSNDHLYEEVSEVAIVTASTAHLTDDSPVAVVGATAESPLSNGHTSPISLSPVVDAFSDAEDEYRRGASGRHRRSLLQLLRIGVKAKKSANDDEKKTKKKKKKKKKEKGKKTTTSPCLSDSDADTPNHAKTKKSKRRWWLFGARSPDKKAAAMAKTPKLIIEEQDKETPLPSHYVAQNHVSVLPSRTAAMSSSAGGGEWFIMKPQGSAEIRRRQSIEQSAREEMKEASKLAAALRRANMTKRRADDEDEAAKLQKLEDEADRERAKKTSTPQLPSFDAANRRLMPLNDISGDEDEDVEEFASTRLVNESLNSELKIQKRSSKEIILREDGESEVEENDVDELVVIETETKEEEVVRAGTEEKEETTTTTTVEKVESEVTVEAAATSTLQVPKLPVVRVASASGEEPLYVEFGHDDNPVDGDAKKVAEDGTVSSDDSNDLSRSFDEALLQKKFEKRLETAEAQRRERERLRLKQRHEVISRAETEEQNQRAKETVVLKELEAEKEEERRQREEFQRRKQEAEKRRRQAEEERDRKHQRQRVVDGSAPVDVDTLLARKREEDKRIEEKIARSRKTSPDPTFATHEEEWKKMREAEERAWQARKISKTSYSDVTLTKEKTAMEVAFKEMNSTFADIGLDGTALTTLAERGDEFPPPLPPPPMFDPVLPSSSSSPSAVPGGGGGGGGAGNDLDLDLLLADLDEALTLANEKIATGNYDDDVASAWGTRQRPKRAKGNGSSVGGTPQSTIDRRPVVGTPQSTMDRRLVQPRGTPVNAGTPTGRTPRNGTPQGSKTATPKISEMRRELSQLIFEGKKQTESFKKKKGKSGKKKKKTDTPASVPVFDDQGHTYPLFIEPDLTVQMALHRVTSLAGRKLVPTLSIVESFEDLHIERRLEDHELIADVIRSWHGSKMCRLILRNAPTKYDLWEKPQLPRNVLIDYCDRKLVPDVSGVLHERDLKKKTWRERMFVLQEDGICGSSVAESHSKRDLVVVAPLKNHHIYTGFGSDKTNKGPSKFCFFLRPTNSAERKDVIGLCAPDADAMVTWIAAYRLIKFGLQLKENYSTMRRRFAALSKQQETTALHY